MIYVDIMMHTGDSAYKRLISWYARFLNRFRFMRIETYRFQYHATYDL